MFLVSERSRRKEKSTGLVSYQCRTCRQTVTVHGGHGRGQGHVFGQRFIQKNASFGRKMDQSPTGRNRLSSNVAPKDQLPGLRIHTDVLSEMLDFKR